MPRTVTIAVPHAQPPTCCVLTARPRVSMLFEPQVHTMRRAECASASIQPHRMRKYSCTSCQLAPPSRHGKSKISVSRSLSAHTRHACTQDIGTAPHLARLRVRSPHVSLTDLTLQKCPAPAAGAPRAADARDPSSAACHLLSLTRRHPHSQAASGSARYGPANW